MESASAETQRLSLAGGAAPTNSTRPSMAGDTAEEARGSLAGASIDL